MAACAPGRVRLSSPIVASSTAPTTPPFGRSTLNTVGGHRLRCSRLMKGSGADFRKFWTGQTISVLGSAFSSFAMPLLVFQLTHSALNLAITTFTWALPHLLFGLVIGAWVDRVDRKRLMIAVDVLLAATMVAIPALSFFHELNVYWVYAVDFAASSLSLVFQQAEFTAIPSLVGSNDLVTANGRINASYQAAEVLGPAIAGAIVSVVPVTSLYLVDAASYLVSGAALVAVGVSFNVAATGEREPSTIFADIKEGLSYVLRHPVLRNISLMMMLFNLVHATANAQAVLYAKDRLHTTNFELGVLFAAAGLGSVLFSLIAGWLRRRASFSSVVLGCLMAAGMSLTVFALVPWFWLAVPLYLLHSGFASLLNINTFSLRQAIVPNQMLGRVLSVAGLLAFSATPVGSLFGAYAIQATHNLVLVFAAIGVLLFVIPLAFTRTALGRAEQYLPT
jgi:MFS family permease